VQLRLNDATGFRQKALEQAPDGPLIERSLVAPERIGDDLLFAVGRQQGQIILSFQLPDLDGILRPTIQQFHQLSIHVIDSLSPIFNVHGS
jgi:hypothetical protein